MSTKSPDKIMTPEEINSLIPEVENKVKTIQDKKAIYLKAHDALLTHELAAEAEKAAGLEFEDQDLDDDVHILEETVLSLSAYMDEIRDMGGIIRSIEEGLIDFCGEIDGEKIYYSWKMGEEKIQYYRQIKSLKERILLS